WRESNPMARRSPPMSAGLAILLALTSTHAGQEKKSETTFVGLTNDEGVSALLQPVEVKGKRFSLVFVCGVITGEQEYQAFCQAAELKKVPFKVAWKDQVVIYAIHRAGSFFLEFEQWNAPKGGVGELVVKWVGIQPGYGDWNPTVLHRVEKKNLKN